ncbi:MAG: hypothetical protein LBD41_03285, partial [Clostridiales Family XIII bacterium]|nr:hypothetical protein [Clostridiales Family XIII bacterium]
MKLFCLNLLVSVIFLCQINVVAFAQEEACSSVPTPVGTYTGTIQKISCSEVCEITLLLNDGTLMEYMGNDDFREFQYKPGTIIETTLIQLLVPNDDGECEFFKFFVDVTEISDKSEGTSTVNSKGEFGEDKLEDLLQAASKVPENRIGITIKGFQLGMNEYSFLLEAKTHYSLLYKNYQIFKSMGVSNNGSKLDAYILENEDLDELRS